MKKFFKNQIAPYLTRHLFKFVQESEFLTLSEGGVLSAFGRELSNEERKNIINQARTIQKMDIWDMLIKEMTHVGNKRVFFEGKDMESLAAGRTILWTVDVMEKKIDTLAAMNENALPTMPTKRNMWYNKR